MLSFDAVIVSYNTRDLLTKCLESVLPEAPGRIIVLDNASSDASSAMVKTKFPSVVVFENPANRGYGVASNQALAMSQAKYVLLLNGDTRLCPGALQALSDYMDQNPRAALVGPRLLYPDGKLQHSCFSFPTLLDVFLDISNVSRLVGLVPFLRDRYLRTWAHDRPREIPWILGAAVAIRREAFEQVGGFDTSFFLYYEEVDLCYRLKRLGWQIHFTPAAQIIHWGGASARQRPAEMTVQLYSSLAHFYRRHYSPVALTLLAMLIRCAALVRLARDTLLLLIAQDSDLRAQIRMRVRAWRRLLLGPWERESASG